MAKTKKDAPTVFDHFGRLYRANYPAVWGCLKKDREDLFTFYDFPAEYWIHLWTTTLMELTFATPHGDKKASTRARPL